MSFIQTSVPLVFWGRTPPSHDITCICKTEEKRGLATGSATGQVCLWDICKERETEKVKLRPRCMLFGGNSPILAICFVKTWLGDTNKIATLSSKGTVSLWDSKDGACLRFSSIPGRHGGIKSFPRQRHADTLLALYGQYSEISILDSDTLEVLCVLQEAHSPDWVAQLCFLTNIEKKDAVLVVGVDGVAKHWLLPSRAEMSELEVIAEEKSQTLSVDSPPLSLSSFSYHNNYCTVLVVCSKAWQLYDATGGRMKMLMIRPCEPSVSGWMRGEFLDNLLVVVWSREDARAFIYKLSASCVPGITESVEEDSTAGCSILCVLSNKQAPPTPDVAVYLDRHWHVQGDGSGRLYLWDMRKIISSCAAEKISTDHTLPYGTSCSLTDSWEAPALPCCLTDTLHQEESSAPRVTSAVYLTSFGRLVCGHSDGSIAVLSALQAATVLMLEPRRFSRGWPQHCILRGHRGPVSCLFYPSMHSKAYSKDHLLSGGADFTVKLWSLYSGILVHTFAVHGGKIRTIVSCPPDYNPRLQTCVCSIAEDYSVAILSTTEKKCLLVASCHSSPVKSVHWRLDEDFLLVYCTNGRLYVWQIDTGSLDRCVEGETSRTILGTLEEPPSSGGVKTLPSSPLHVMSLNAGSNDQHIQVLLFNPNQLILHLSRMENLNKEKIPKKRATQADALKSYIYARRHFGSGGAPGSAPRRQSVPATPTSSLSMPAPLTSITTHRGSVYQTEGTAATPSRQTERAREVLGKGVANQVKSEALQDESPRTIIDAIRLLLSCLHAWRLDDGLDRQCEQVLGLVRPHKPVSFGLLSKGSCVSLVLPGWGLRSRQVTERREATDGEDILNMSVEGQKGGGGRFTFDQKYHLRWQFSRSLTTQHLLTMVSITNTLMNQSVGAHDLATSSSRRIMSHEEDSDSDAEDEASWDNQIKAMWSRVAALHCVMLPEHMEGKFRPPYLPVLASRFLDPCQAIREASQALLQAELRRIGVDGRKALVKEWSGKLHHTSDHTDSGSHGPVPSHQFQTTALIILGMIGAEFHEGDKTPLAKRKGEHSHDTREVMDPTVARRTGRKLQQVLLEKPSSKSPLHSNLRCSAAELLGRGFQLWEKYIDIPRVVMGLLDLVQQYVPPPVGVEASAEGSRRSNRSMKFASEVARKALNLMIILKPVTMVTTLAKEVSTYLASQHVTSYPHSSIQPVQVGTSVTPNTGGIVALPDQLLLASRGEVLDLMKTVIEKSQQKLALQLLEVVDIVLFCLDQDSLKKKNLLELFPPFSRISSISYSFKSKRLSVGARNGQVAIYDLKQGKTQMLNAHPHVVTALHFSDDGRMLASYSYGDSRLCVWQISSSVFGITQTPKFVNGYAAIGSSSSTNSSYVRLEWQGSKTVILYMPGGMECKFSL